MNENQIVVYQPNETVRLEVRMENETVWLTQSQMAELFDCTVRNIRLHLANIYECGELVAGATRKDFFLVRMEGARKVSRTVTCYNLDAIISVGYRVNSVLGVKFRQWATGVLRDFLLKGYAVNGRLNQLEETVTTSAAFHDRFLILDESEIYLIGASLKDLGKKCFAFSKLDAANIDGILTKIS